MRVMIIHACSLLLEHADDIECRALTHVVDVLLVRNAEHEYAAAVHRFAVCIQRLRNALDYERGHFTVDLARKIDKPRLVVERAHLPREVVRIERNAVPANSRPRSELHEPERLGSGCLDHFPDIYAELVADN